MFILLVNYFRTGRERHATPSMVFSRWAMSWTATSSSSPTTVGTLGTHFATTITPTSAPRTRTMTSVWTTVPNSAKVRHHDTDYRFIGKIKHFWPLFSTRDLFCRWLLVQLLHRLKPEWCVLSPRDAHQELRWHHLVRLAWTKLLPQTGWDEDPTPELQSLKLN